MSYSKENQKTVKDAFVSKKISAELEADKRKKEAEAKIPEIAVINKLLSETGLRVMEAAVSGKNVELKIKELKEENNALRKKREELLIKNGYPENYTDVKYDCNLCMDEGFVGTKMCSCMRQALISAGIESSGIGKLIKKHTFSNFSLDYYDGPSRAVAEQNYNIIKDAAYSLSADKPVNMLLIGPTGLGKTHLSAAFAGVAIERGFDVMCDTAISFFSAYEDQRFRNKQTPDGYDKTEKFREADVLIIDDLGTELSSQFTLSVLYDIINTRLNKSQSTLINTNFTPAEIRGKYSDRITSRLFGEYLPLIFSGSDIRAKKLM